MNNSYFKIIYRTGEEDWETGEIIVDEEQHAKIQKQMSEGSDFIFIKDKATIKRTAIVSITSANDIVANYQKQGLKVEGFLEPPNFPKITGRVQKVGDFLKETKKDFFKRMGWKDFSELDKKGDLR